MPDPRYLAYGDGKRFVQRATDGMVIPMTKDCPAWIEAEAWIDAGNALGAALPPQAPGGSAE